TLLPSLPVFFAVALALTLSAVIAVVSETPVLAQAPSTDEDAAAKRRQQMGAVRNWGYWLSSFDVPGVAAAPHDLMVIDNELSADRSFEREFRPAEVERMKHGPDGSPRVLLAYLSISEAERYRRYWQQDWYDPSKKREWLGRGDPRGGRTICAEDWGSGREQPTFGERDRQMR